MRALLCLTLCLFAAPAAYSQCSSFQPAYPGLNGPVHALTSWTPAGLTSPRLVAGGAFTDNQQGSQDYIAQWNGAAWDRFGWGTNGPVNAVVVWDPDGPGPLPPQLIIGGEFTAVGADSTGQVDANHIARWDGAAWQPLGTGTDGPVDALTVWDPDGDGPQPAQLIAAGRFTHAGTAWTGGVAHWDGTTWGQLGWGIDGSGAALTTWDPDGAGPLTAELVVGGAFLHAGADSTGQIVANGVARWDGSAWHAFGSGVSLTGVTAVATLSPDPTRAADLYAGCEGIFRWDGSAWRTDGRGFAFYFDGQGYVTAGVTALASWDADGSGFGPPQLVAAGVCAFTVYGEGDQQHSEWHPLVAISDGSGWRLLEMSNGMYRALTPLATAPGEQPAFAVGHDQSALINILQETPEPHVAVNPLPRSARLGDAAIFSVIGGPADSYGWYLVRPDGVWIQLSDGRTSSGSLIAGAASSTLTISNITDSDAAGYICELFGACGNGFSTTARLSIICSADFNHDGDSATDADIEDFFACLSGNCCPTCDSPDFNGDGDSGTDADIEAFFRVLAGGPC